MLRLRSSGGCSVAFSIIAEAYVQTSHLWKRALPCYCQPKIIRRRIEGHWLTSGCHSCPEDHEFRYLGRRFLSAGVIACVPMG